MTDTHLLENWNVKYKHWRGTEIHSKCSVVFVPLYIPKKKVTIVYFCCIVPKNRKKDINDLDTDWALKIKCSL
jgi:hypothetical protein